MSIEQKIISCGVLFILTNIFGIWLSNLGRPYNSLLFTIHKLVAVAAVVLTTTLVINLLKNSNVESLISILLIIAAIAVLVLFISGALMSIGKAPYLLVKYIHIIAPIVAGTTIVLSLFLMLRRRTL